MPRTRLWIAVLVALGLVPACQCLVPVAELQGSRDHAGGGGPTVAVIATRLPWGRQESAAAWDGTDIYLFGGVSTDGQTDQILRFSPRTETVTVLPQRLPAARQAATAVWTGSQILVVGGAGAERDFSQIVRFDPATHAVTTAAAQLPTPRRGVGVAWTGRVAYLVGGYSSGSYLTDVL